MTVDLKGFAFNLGGVAVDGATAQVFTKNTSSQVGSDVTTGAGALLDGEFEFNGLAEGLYDVKVTSGSSIRWRKYDDEIQTAIMETASLRVRGTNAAYAHVITGTPTATRAVTIPDAAGTLPLLSLAQTWSAIQTHSAAIIVTDATDSTTGGTGSVHTAGGIGAVLDIVTNKTLKPLGDTSAGDVAALGYTSTLGAILTGQGSTYDVTIVNDADATVMGVTTGTTGVVFAGVITATSAALTTPVLNTSVSGSAFQDDDAFSSASGSKLASSESIKAYVDTRIATEDTLAELNDTNISSPAIGHILVYDNTASVWDNVAINAADGLTATLGDGTLELDLDAALTTVTSILRADIKIGEDDQTKIDFETEDEIHLYAANVEQVYVADNIFGPQSDSDVDLGTTGVRWKDAFIDTVTTTGLVTAGSLTVTGTTTLNGDVTLGNHIDDVITINGSIAGANAVIFEGATGGVDAYESTLAVVDPTADHTIYLPNKSGHLGVFDAASTTQISSTPEELNLLDGVSGLVQADFTKLAAVTSTAAELNLLTSVSGLVQADLTKLAAIDATDSEIDLLDGSAKLTSSITIDDADAFIVIDGNTTKQIPASDLSNYVVAEGSMSSFQLEDDSGDEVTINNANEIKLIGSGITTNWTDTDNGTDGDPYDMTFTVDTDQTVIESIINSSLKMGRDSQNLIDFATTDDKIILRVANVDEVELVANVLQPTTNDGVALGTTSLGWSDLHLATAGVINWANGEMTITEGADVLTVAGGTFATAALTAIGALTVGVDDTGHDVKFFGAAGGAYMEWDQSEDQLRLLGPSADAAGSSGKLLLATAQTDVQANDILGQIDFRAPLETQGGDGALVTASIQAIAQATFTATVNSTDLMFYTATDGAVTEKFRITSDGELGIGGANYGTDGQVLTSAGASAAAAWEDAGGGGADVQAFTSGGTWCKPAGATSTLVVLHSAGGGGGSGRVGTNISAVAGGGGGSGGGFRMRIFKTSDLASEETVTVGSGGAGGAAQTSDDTGGNSGSNGGASSFGAWITDTDGIGLGGNGGSASNVDGKAGGTGTDSGGRGGDAGVGVAPAGADANASGGGGGGGGRPYGYDRDGGNGGKANFLSATAAAGGTANTGNAGVTPSASGYGGSGSGSSAAQNSGAGGAGVIPGGGGGGTGGTNNGYDSGAAGAGARGDVVVYSW